MKYLGKMNKLAVKFMNDILKMDPKERLTALEALRHPYFDGLNNEFKKRSESRNNSKRESIHRSKHLKRSSRAYSTESTSSVISFT